MKVGELRISSVKFGGKRKTYWGGDNKDILFYGKAREEPEPYDEASFSTRNPKTDERPQDHEALAVHLSIRTDVTGYISQGVAL